MLQAAEARREEWRLIVVRDNGAEFLAIEKEGLLTLPRVKIPKGSRAAEELNHQLKTIWHLDSFSLHPLTITPLDGGAWNSRVHVAEAVHHHAPAPTGASWVSASALDEIDCFAAADLAAVHAWRDDLTRDVENGAPTPFGKPGSLARLQSWVQQALQPSGLAVGTGFVQLNADKRFSLVRFETEKHAVWFKAVGEPNIREFPLTVALSELFPEYLPHLFATAPQWNAWLADEVPGVRLSDRDDTDAWASVARDLAGLQVSSLPWKEQIMECGSRDIRSDVLLAKVAPFFAMLRELMEAQTNSLPPRLSDRDLTQLESDTRDALSDLHEDDMPDSLGHLDLNPGNIIVSATGTKFLDWAEASVGHPFLTLAYLLEYFRRNIQASPHGPPCLIREYERAWKSRGYLGSAEKSICLALFLAIFAHAVSTDPWQTPSQLLKPSVAGYYRSLARRMKSYSSRIRAGATCPTEVWA